MAARLEYIAHLDLDCFYVSVERIRDPSLNGKPVIVGGSPSGRGVVASASYEARAFGVRSAMPTGKALRLCPQAIVVRSHFDDYGMYSDDLYRRMKELSPLVERASIDEMYFDLTGCESLYNNDLPGFTKKLKKLVWDEFKLPCTIALASNKTLAKIAAGTVKPNGVLHVPHGKEREFLAPLPVEVIPGVGKKTEEILKRRGFRVLADLQAVPREQVTALLGKHGFWIHDVARGMGSTTVHESHVRKGISSEETFSHDIADRIDLEKKLFSLVEGVCFTMRSRGWKSKTVTLKLRYSDFKTITRSESIPPTNDDAVVFRIVRALLQHGYTRPMALRLLGVRLTNFEYEPQQELLLIPFEEKRGKALTAVDRLRKKFGDGVIHSGGA